jgi:hypothetical protein
LRRSLNKLVDHTFAATHIGRHIGERVDVGFGSWVVYHTFQGLVSNATSQDPSQSVLGDDA